MKPIVRYLILFAALSLLWCAAKAPNGPSSPIDPIFPKTESILPLAQGNAWTYSYTAYDSLGHMILPHRLDLHIAINAQYGIQNDTTLVLLTRYNYQTHFPDYAYQYEMEAQGKGYLVVYRSLYPLAVRGLYIIGEYNGTAIQLYPSEQFWLAYPADSGKTWQFKPDPLGDSAKVTAMQLVSTNAHSYMLEPNSMSGIAVIDSCYCYQQSNIDTVAYYYYHPKFGAISYERYIGGKLRETYILKSFGTVSY
jgi:hypothetical protein